MPNGSWLRIGSTRLGQDQSRAMMTAMLTPLGEVKPCADVPPPSSGKLFWYEYEAQSAIEGGTAPGHRFRVRIQTDGNDALKFLAAESPTHPLHGTTTSAFCLHFSPLGRSDFRFLSLPWDLAVKVAGHTGASGHGINVALLRVSRDMHAIAWKALSPEQSALLLRPDRLEAVKQTVGPFALTRLANHSIGAISTFVQARGPLMIAGYTDSDVRHVAIQSGGGAVAFLADDALLTRAGYTLPQRRTIARLAGEQRRFFINHDQTLRRAGYDLKARLAVSSLPAEARQFFMENERTLHSAGYPFSARLAISRLPAQAREFAKTYDETLQLAGYTVDERQSVFGLKADSRVFLIENNARLEAAGYRPCDRIRMAACSADWPGVVPGPLSGP